MAIQGVLFGIEGVLRKAAGGDFPDDIRRQMQKLFDFMRTNGMRPVVVGNRPRVFNGPKGEKLSMKDVVNRLYGDHSHYVLNDMGLPPKPTAGAVRAVLQRESLDPKRTVFIGSSDVDFRSAINSKQLFLNATWDGEVAEYGFRFKTPDTVRRFLELFGLKKHPWFYEIVNGTVHFVSLAPFSTLKPEFSVYSAAAKSGAKDCTKERQFFLASLVVSLYETGLMEKVDYIAAVPGHEAGSGNPSMDDILKRVGGIFRTRYLSDLIIRHTTARKMQHVRQSGQKPTPLDQLNTIHLNRYPMKNESERYKNGIGLSGKTVLVLDDFCTEGYSLEAARINIEQAGGKAILVSWLKTINSNYQVMSMREKFDPYKPNSFASTGVACSGLNYRDHICDYQAPEELQASYEKYLTWTA